MGKFFFLRLINSLKIKGTDSLRIHQVYIFLVCLFLILSLRIVYLQAFKKDFFRKLAQNQYYRLIRLEGKRGRILDRKGRTLATTINYYSIFADPSIIDNPEYIAERLSSKLNFNKEDIIRKLTNKNKFLWIKRKIPWNQKERIKSLKLKGIGFIRETKRFYPQGNLASHVLGIVNVDNRGLEGIELSYDRFLRGKEGWVRVLHDSTSKKVILTPKIITPQDGADVSLTIDSQLQYWTETYLEQTIKQFIAKAGSVIIMDASSGEILALANYPPFDPNKLDKDSLKFLKNNAIVDYFEPGSVFKIVTLLTAIKEGKFLDEDKIFCENGLFKIPGSYLHDWKKYGELTFKEVFIKSSNIGVAKIATFLGKDLLYDYMKKLEFGEKTGVDLAGEAKGMIKPTKKWSKTSEYVIPIGQEVGVSLLQLVRAFAAIVNGGYLVKPHLIKGVSSQGFYRDYGDKVFKRKRTIGKATAQRAKDILIEVVQEGTGELARVPGMKIGGKTGTAQKYDPLIRRYSPTKYRATFIGFIANIEPPLVIGVTLDEPRKHHFGGVVAAPLFKKIAERAIAYLGDRKIIVKKQ